MPLLDLIRSRFASMPLVAYALAGTSFINRMGGTAKLFMALYLRESLHLDLTLVGILLSLYGVGLFAGSYLVSVLTDRFQPRRLLFGTLYASAVCLAALCFVTAPLALGVWLVLGGLADGGYRPALQRVMMRSCDALQRTRAQAMQRVAINLGFAVGGVAGGLFAESDYRLVFAADAMTSVLAALFLYWAMARVAADNPSGSATAIGGDCGRWPYTDVPYLWFLLACLLLATVYAQSESTMSNYLREYLELSPFWIGMCFALNGAMVGLLQIPITLHAERWPVRRAMMLGAAVLTAGFALLPLGAGAPPVAAIVFALGATAIYTVGEMLLMPPQVTLMMQRADTGRAGHYLALYNGVWGGRLMLGPLLGNGVYDRWGGHAVWAMCAVLGSVAVLVQWHAIRRLQQSAT